MSTLTPSDINAGNTAVGVVVVVAFILHQIPIYLSVDVSKHPKEDEKYFPEEARKPLAENSSASRWAGIARNNAENLWQGVIVFLVSKGCVERGSSPFYNEDKSDNKGYYKFLTAMMYLFVVCRISHTVCYKMGINAPVPVRSICFFLANIAVWCSAIMIPITMSKFKMPVA